MKKYIILCLATLLFGVSGFPKDIVVKSPGYFKEPVRDEYPLFPDSLVFSSDAEEIVIPDVSQFGRLRDYGEFPKLRKITFGDADYLPGYVLNDLPNLEEVVFDGMIGHFDCTFIAHCPKLRTITFRGPVSSTGGPTFLYNLPNLEKVVFESVVVNLGLDFDLRDACPKLAGVTNNGAFLTIYDDSLASVATLDQLKANPKLIADMERVARWQSEVLRAKNPGFMRGAQYKSAKILQPVLAQLNSAEAANLKASMEYALSLIHI